MSPFAPENLVSRDKLGRPVPHESVHSPHSGWTRCLLPGFLPLSATTSICLYRQPPFSATASIYLYRQPPSGQSRIHQVVQLRTDGVHGRESAGIGPIVLKVVRVSGDTFSDITIDRFLCLSFPTPTVGTVCMLYRRMDVWPYII